MKLHFTNDWLRRKIEKDRDIECDSGIPILDSSSLDKFVSDARIVQNIADKENKMAVLNVLVYQLRRRDKLSIIQLAHKIKVDPKEIENIESDPDFTPRPRTLHQLAHYMNVPTKGLQSVTSEAIARNDNIAREVLKFAARSGDLSELSKVERRHLNAFVKFLSSFEKEK